MSNASMGKRDPSKQGHRTPKEFLHAVQRRFGRITFDLAATEGHQVLGVQDYFTPEIDALKQDWSSVDVWAMRNRGLEHPIPMRVSWLNPPFSHIQPWVAKLEAECRTLPWWTLCLVPASMGSKWWERHVLHKCVALGVTRLTFVGSDSSYPKDLALLGFGFGVSGHGFWDWQDEASK